MKRTPNEDKALAWYCETYNLRPELSAHPTYHFTNKDTGEKTTRFIGGILSQWQEWREAQKHARKEGA